MLCNSIVWTDLGQELPRLVKVPLRRRQFRKRLLSVLDSVWHETVDLDLVSHDILVSSLQAQKLVHLG